MPDCTDLEAAVARTALAQAARDNLSDLDSVVAAMKKRLPQLTREEVANSIDAFLRPSKKNVISDVVKALNSIKSEAKTDVGLRKKIEDIEKRLKLDEKKPEPKIQKKAFSEAIQLLKNRLSELKATETLDNKIKSLEKQLKTGEEPPKRIKIAKPKSKALQALEIKKKGLQDKIFDIKKKKTAEEKRVATLKKRINELENEIKTGKKPTKRPKAIGEESKAVQELKAKKQELKNTLNEIKKNKKAEAAETKRVKDLGDQIQDLQKQIKTGKIKEPVKRIPKEKTQAVQDLETTKKELQKRANLLKTISDLENTLAQKTIEPKTPQVKAVSRNIEELQFKRNELRQNIDERIRSLEPKTIFQKTLSPITGGFNMSRAFMTSLDVSAVLRQGGVIALAHPIRGSKAMVPMFKAFASKKLAFKAMEEIKSRDNAFFYKKDGLDLTEIDGPLRKQEEAMASRIAKKVPLVAGSQRAFSVFLNRLRADSYDAMVATLGRNGKVTRSEGKAIANFINIATGRGDLGKLSGAGETLNSFFFAPKLVASRFQLLTAQPLRSFTLRGKKFRDPNTARVRNAIIKEYAKFLTGFSTIVGLASLTLDGEVEFDSRSSDFLKIKVDNTRIDIGTGLLQPIVLTSKIFGGETISTTTGKVRALRGDVVFGGDNAFVVSARFLRTKFSPSFGLAVNLATGKDVVGDPVTVSTVEGITEVSKDLLMPLSFRDIFEAMKEQGVPKGSALAAINLLGAGLSTYNTKKKTRRRKVVRR